VEGSDEQLELTKLDDHLVSEAEVAVEIEETEEHFTLKLISGVDVKIEEDREMGITMLRPELYHGFWADVHEFC
jgi:D-lyxose ketol-isomerase